MKPEVATETTSSLAEPANAQASTNAPPQGSYVKHAMRNMVRKRGKSLQHFFLSTVGMLALFVGLAYMTR